MGIIPGAQLDGWPASSSLVQRGDRLHRHLRGALTGGSGGRIDGIWAGQKRGHIELIDEPAIDEQAL